MERLKVKLDELKKWKEKFETGHKMWNDEIETEQEKLINDLQLQCLSNRESKDGRRYLAQR